MLKHGATGLALEGAAKGAPKDAANVRPCAATKAVAVAVKLVAKVAK